LFFWEGRSPAIQQRKKSKNGAKHQELDGISGNQRGENTSHWALKRNSGQPQAMVGQKVMDHHISFLQVM